MQPWVLLSLALALHVASPAHAWRFKKHVHACGVCADIAATAAQDPAQWDLLCARYGACEAMNSTVMHCDEHCGVPQPSENQRPKSTSSALDLRVTKGFGTKPYASLRISVVQREGQPGIVNESEFDYSARFRYKWTGNHLHSKIVEVPSGTSEMTIGNTSISLRLPAQGAGTAGVLIADPCIRSGSITALLVCTNAKKFKTRERTPALLNAVLSHNDTDFWGILGDNFYDRYGKTTAEMYDQFDLSTKSKIMLTVPGNHDYWVLGSPTVASSSDQFANGHMQWYAQDAKAAHDILAGDSRPPFNFSVDPHAVAHPAQQCTYGVPNDGCPNGQHCHSGQCVCDCAVEPCHLPPCSAQAQRTNRLPSIENAFWYNQVGNIGFVGYSGAYSLNETYPYMEEACSWLASQPKVQIGIVVGHWDNEALGCQPAMDGPLFHQKMAKLPGCDALNAKGMFKFVMGHTHCNVPHPHGNTDTGFMVAGQGMEGCGNYGLPVVDTTEGRVRIWYFDVYSQQGVDKYEQIITCLKAKGWRKCTEFATSWLDQPIPES